jgi:hypothetical protein
MSQNIALTLTLGGTQKAVSSIAELETALAEAKNELKGLEIGSKAFTKLASDVKIADQRLKDLNKQVEGKDLEARIGDFGKLGGAVGASFASATAAIQLFGFESEDSLAAVTKAQNALTLALGAKAAAEGAYVVKQYASIVATKAQISVTNLLNASTKAFFTTLLTNPFTALLAALGAIIGAMVLLNDETETVTKTFVDLNEIQKEATKSTVGETQKLKELQRIVTDTNTSQRIRLEAYKELQKIVPSLAAFTLEQAINEGILNKEIQDQITLIENRAKAKAIETKITELYQQQFDLVFKAQKELSAFGKEASEIEAKIALQRQGQVGVLGDLAAQYQENQKQVEFLTRSNSAYGVAVNNVLEIQGKQSEILEKLNKQKEADAEAEKKRLEAEKLRADAEARKLFLAGEISKAELDALLRVDKFVSGDAEIVKELEEKIATQEKWIGTLGLEKTRLQERDEVIEANRTNEDEAFNRFKNYTDAFKSYLEEVRNGKSTTKDFAKEIAALGDGAQVTRKGLEGLVSPATLVEFDKYQRNLEVIAKSFDLIIGLGKPLSDTFKDYLTELEATNDETLTAVERSQAAGKATDLLAKATQQYIDKQRSLGSTLKEEILTANFNTIVNQIKLATTETTAFEDGVEQVNEKVKALNNELESNVELTKNAFDKEGLKDFITGLQEGLQNVQGVLGAFQQTFQQSFDFQFDLLEKRYKRITEGIIGDSEESKNKRIEAERAYQAERERLEKQAAKTQLRISLAQSIANTAEAITRVFAQTGIGGIIAGSLVAAASAASTVTIAQQLAAIDSYQRGGIMRKRGGGLVTGNSHEFGGVKFQGGGVELEGNEAIINRVSTINYMGLLDQINQAGGGAPISSAANESRLIEAIAKQRNTPIRAYVVESDITAKQETARRLETLSQF